MICKFVYKFLYIKTVFERKMYDKLKKDSDTFHLLGLHRIGFVDIAVTIYGHERELLVESNFLKYVFLS